ncbi:hypothetical protein RvY_10424 [Ramazzottius varieornatus]|uniref:F-box domain-containing protein n=1 Tax=Ramazzottius varieornatus TaxID=947166 RepID=A0A1D1VF57_RAMVA|nr:hypothetical protein RvY_10424 [Ramazzottius varieornatus]
MDLAMHDKQWQYMDDFCVRLRTVEEYSPMESEASWDCIHRDLQVDILSYFDVIYRSRLRRVCREWNETMQSHWDAEVNRCLYFDFSKHYDVENTMIKGCPGLYGTC